MISDLPSPLLRSFVAVVDCGSLSAASARVGRSESALSLQMSRLEDIVGQQLFQRDGRTLKLNQAGGLLLSHARAILSRIDAARVDLGSAAAPPVRIGIVQDFVDAVLRPTLTDIRADGGWGAITIVIGSTVELLQALGEERIDTAFCAGDPPGAMIVKHLPMDWFGDPILAGLDVLPLVGITPPCPFLRAAQQSLDAVGRSWRMALVTPSLDSLRAAAQAGLGLTCRTEIGMGLQPLRGAGLPLLPKISYSVIERRRDGGGLAARRMREHFAALHDSTVGSHP